MWREIIRQGPFRRRREKLPPPEPDLEERPEVDLPPVRQPWYVKLVLLLEKALEALPEARKVAQLFLFPQERLGVVLLVLFVLLLLVVLLSR